METRRITVLGTGRMGSALALAFLSNGHTVTVWNRTASKAAALEGRGCRVASSIEQAITSADIVVGNVSDYSATESVLAPASVSGALRGKLFVQLATGTPRQAREAATWAREREIAYLDGAIMATPDFIGQPGCTILYSGSPELFEKHRAVFASLGGNPLHVGGDVGHASALDAAILIVFWGSLFGTWQAAALCEAEGFPLQNFASALAATMPVLQGAVADSVQRIAARRFAADETTFSSVETCHASARLIHQMTREHGIHPGLSEALEVVFRRAAEAGRSGDDVASVYQGLGR